MAEKPSYKPENPRFSSGPCRKPPGWSLDRFTRGLAGRYHRSMLGRQAIDEVMTGLRRLLDIPDDYTMLLVPGSDTGAMEAAMWNLLGPRRVDVLAFDRFGHEWLHDVENELGLPETHGIEAPYGALPDLSAVNPSHDLVFAWTGTTAGVCVPDGAWIDANREGLVLCDAISAVFCLDLPWDRLDATSFSWQKAMGGEAQHGVLVLSPRAVERLKSHLPSWPIPKSMRLSPEVLTDGLINTPSLLCIEDALVVLERIEAIGGLAAMIDRGKANFAVLDAWVATRDDVAHLAEIPETRPPSPVCLKLTGPFFDGLGVEGRSAAAERITSLLEKEGVAFDIQGYRTAPPGLRIWTGGAVEAADIKALLPWLEWALGEVTGEGA